MRNGMQENRRVNCGLKTKKFGRLSAIRSHDRPIIWSIYTVFRNFNLAFITLALFLGACGGGSSSDSDSSGASAYTITFSEDSMQAEGRSVISFTIADSSGNGIAGLGPAVSTWMEMETKNHSTPMSEVTDNGDGSYTVEIYYLMSSTMNGMSMGTWHVDVTVGDQMASHYPEVMMSMGDTTKVTLKNDSDQFAGMLGPETRSYFIFLESCGGSMQDNLFEVYLATRDSMMSHPPVYTGQTLHDAGSHEMAISGVTIEASSDNGATWWTMTQMGGGMFSISGLDGMVDGVQGTILVKLAVNGVQYSTDGATASGENAYQTFSVTPGSSMSM